MTDELNPAQLREQYDALVKDHGKLKTTNATLERENRTLKAEKFFGEAGLSPLGAELFVATNPEGDITVDTVKAFAEKYGVGSVATGEPEGGEAADETTPPSTEGLKNMERAGSGSGAGSQQGAGGEKTLSSKEFTDLLKRDKAAAQQALAEGRVVLRDDNPLARDRVAMGDVNPFEQFNRSRLEETKTP